MLITRATMRDGHVWYEVLLPIRPNGSSAWVRSTDVKVRERSDRLEVDLSKRELIRYHDDQVVDRFRVGVGTDAFPTTTGTFYVYIKVPYADPNQAYGIMALGLSGFSRVITDWPGGGRIAVHGTPNASDRGDAVSHGCVRVYNPDMEHLTDLPLGTPVEIHA
jgi:lipoprotein-anchoring transpeptidase ErfK/SrfK